jgi:phospholipid transport system substrate-binding protein
LLIGLFFCVAMPVWADGAASTAVTPPDQVVETTAKAILAAVAAKREDLKQHPMDLYGVVQKDLLPHFDFDRASRMVLGAAWRNATAAQRKAFQDAFIKYMIRSYADGLLQGNYSDRNLQMEPWHGSLTDKTTVVKTKVLRENGQPVAVDYQMVNTPEGWKAFDVTIEGISYVINYSNQFGPEIQQKGLDELIQRLNEDSAKAPAQNGAGKG